MPHIDEGRLHAWLDRERSGMSRAEAAEIERHLATCAECRAETAVAERLRARAGSILAGAGPARVEVPAFETLVPRPIMTTRRRRSPARAMVITAWAASVMLAIGLGWFSRDLFQNEQVALESAPMVAADSPVEAELQATGPAAGASSGTAPVGAGVEPIGATQQDLPPTPAPASAAPEAAPAPPAAPLADSAPPAMARAAEPAAPTPGERVVSGQVLDERGRPLESVAIQVPGTDARALTDPQGNYSLTLPPGADEPTTLSATRSGFAPESVAVSPDSDLEIAADFRLRSEAVALSEITAATTADSTPADAPDSARPDVPDSAPADAAAAPRPSAADAPAARGFARSAAASGWSAVAREEAEVLLRQELVTLAELPIAGIEVRVDGESPIVRLTQLLSDGTELHLFQRLDAEIDPETAEIPDGWTTVSDRRDDVHLLLAGSLGEDALTILLRRAE